MKAICVFCGASAGNQAVYTEAARTLGTTIAREGLTLVYGGGKVGLMGILADAALAAGGKVIGVIPEALCGLELAHQGLSELRVVPSMHERKALMAELSDGFIALPGGIGTLEEFFEIWTWCQLGIHRKPCALLNAGGYYDLLLAFLDRSVVSGGFVQQKSRDIVQVSTECEIILQRFRDYSAPDVRRFLGKDQV